MSKRVLLIEDRETTRLMVEETLRRAGYEVSGRGTVASGRERLHDETPDLLLTDLQLPDGTGLELLALALEQDKDLPVIVMSAFGTIEIAVEAIKSGAYDFVTKPFDTNHLVSLVANALERRPRAASAPDDSGILGQSPAIRAAVAAARKVAPSDATVLVLGESGTGKELVARAIHEWSGRARGPLVTVNCAAVPRELMESEFFGSERGSYTGSVARQLGKVELACGGTLFLDEIAELTPELQPKLLRVLQERTFTRIGGPKEIQADIRVIAATNQSLEDQVRKGHFREDLYYRLNVFPIRVPPLRERGDDVLALAGHFVAEAAERLGQPPPEISAGAAERLRTDRWSGNVRELQNRIERAVILTEGSRIRPEDLAPIGSDEPPEAELPAGLTLRDVGRLAQRRAETEAIRAAIRATDGNKAEAARQLGVSYKTLWAKLKEYEIG